MGHDSGDSLLFHQSFNEAQAQTMVLLHGLGSDHPEFESVIPPLDQFHLIVPDMNGHSASRHIAPWTMGNTADSLGKLVLAKARNAQAILVGFSAGGYAAVKAAFKYPHLFEAVVVSGVYDMSPRARLIHLVRCLDWVAASAPVSLVYYLRQKAGIPLSKAGILAMNDNYRNTCPGDRAARWANLLTFKDGDPLPMRALAIAGTKHDDVAGVSRVGAMFRLGNSGSRAIAHDGPHAWF